MRQRVSKFTNSISEKWKKRKPVPNGGTSSSLAPTGTDVSLPSPSPASAPQSVRSQFASDTNASLTRTDDDTWALAFRMAQEREGKLMLAYEEYLSSLQGDNAGGGGLSTAEFIKSIVKRAIEEREGKRWRVSLLGTDIEIRAQAERLTKFLLWSDSIVKVAVSNQPYAALAWSGVSLLLPLVTSSITQNEAMLKGFNSIGDVQMYWRICEETYLPSLDESNRLLFIDPLAKLYSFVIEYQARVICHLAKGQLSRAWDDIANPGEWDEKIQEIHQLNDKCRDILHLANADQIERNWKEQLLEMQESRSFLDKIYNTLLEGGMEAQKSYEDQNERSLLHALASDYQGYKDFNPQKVEGTCQWFFTDERFRNWRDSNVSSLLWVSAGPGCGKSVLSRALIDERRLSTNITTSTVCYFFFKDGDDRRMYAHNALSAILHQLFTHDSTGRLIAQALSTHKSFGETLSHNFSELWEILMRCARSTNSGEIICVIDALDECHEKSRMSLIEKLREYYRCPSDLPSKLKFLVTSRPYDDIGASFKKLSGTTTYLRFDGDDKSGEISNEINLVIDARVDEIAEGFEEKDRRLIANRLKSMEHRTYLWLYLTLDIIMKSPSEYGKRVDVEALLASLPSEVSEAYEKILDRSKRHGYTEALLQILLAATRPLTLYEANFALTMAAKEQRFESHATLKEELWPPKSFKDDVKNLCGLFVSVYDGKLSFIHQTAREFLIHPQREGTWKGRFTLQKAHSRLSRACLQYLLLPDVASVPHTGRDTFFSYAAGSWDLHFMSQEAADADLSRKDAHMVCCAASVWGMHRSWGFHNWNDPTSLAIASYLGLQRVVQYLLLEEAEAALLDVSGALVLASKNGHQEIVQMLLEHGADISIKDLVNALQTASRQGYKEIVQMLLEHGADTSIEDLGLALRVASIKGHKEIVQMLLGYGADAGIEYLSRALRAASIIGHKEIVQVLLEYGAGVSIEDLDNALQTASDGGHEEIVQMLQERGAI